MSIFERIIAAAKNYFEQNKGMEVLYVGDVWHSTGDFGVWDEESKTYYLIDIKARQGNFPKERVKDDSFRKEFEETLLSHVKNGLFTFDSSVHVVFGVLDFAVYPDNDQAAIRYKILNF